MEGFPHPHSVPQLESPQIDGARWGEVGELGRARK